MRGAVESVADKRGRSEWKGIEGGHVCSTQPDLAAQRADEKLHLLCVMGERRRRAPDRARPGDVALTACDDVHVQLRHGIAESCNVELVAFGDVLQHAG